MKKIFLLLIFVFPSLTYSQSLNDAIEVVGQDSLKFYYSEGKLVDKACAEYYRIAQMNPRYFSFEGHAQDFSIDGQLIVDANYKNNLLHGPYTKYYSNGQVQEQGLFDRGNKVGKWNKWYENGQKHMTLIFTENDFYLWSFHNEKGIQKIAEGNGRYEGYANNKKTSISGKLRNGKMNGSWFIRFIGQNGVSRKELYKDGAFLKGRNTLKEVENDGYSVSYSEYDHMPYMSKKGYFNEKHAHEFLKLLFLSDYSCQKRIVFETQNDTPARYQSTASDEPFFDYIYMSLDPSTKGEGYALIASTIGVDGKLTDLQVYSTLADSLTDSLKEVFDSCELWTPKRLNGSFVESRKLFAFQFDQNGYKLLSDPYQDFKNLKEAAVYKHGSFEKVVNSKLKIPSDLVQTEHQVSVVVNFLISPLGKLTVSEYQNKHRESLPEEEKRLYDALLLALLQHDDWQPAMNDQRYVSHPFKGILTVKNGEPEFRLMSNHYVL